MDFNFSFEMETGRLEYQRSFERSARDCRLFLRESKKIMLDWIIINYLKFKFFICSCVIINDDLQLESHCS